MRIENWDNIINSDNYLRSAIEVINILDSKFPNSSNYLVGGIARDLFMGNSYNDIDISTSIDIEELEKLFKNYNLGNNKSFGVIGIIHNDYQIEIAHFRSESEYTDGRHPDEVELVNDFYTDSSRRDLTCNAMAIDKQGNIVDYHNGIQDIQNKIIRMVGNADERIAEDSLRLLRVIRFASRLKFDIEKSTFNALKNYAHMINRVSPERVTKELLSMASAGGKQFSNSILLLKKTGLLGYILPEVLLLNEYEHSGDHHPECDEDGKHTVFIHVIEALRNSDFNDSIINMSILFHDLGKTKTFSIEGDGLKHFYGHDNVGVKIIDNIADRLKFDNNLRKTTQYVAKNHMKYHKILEMSNKKVAELIDSPYFDVLQASSYADDKSRGNLFHDKRWQRILDKIERIKEMYKGRKVLAEIGKVVNGRLIMKLRNLSGGSEIGRIKNATIEWILNENINISDSESIEKYILNI